MKKVIIVGAGFGGLSAAALLAKKGYSVTILEKNEQSGGRASVFTEQGFTFDMGPSWYLIREAFQNFFAQFNKTEEDFYELIRLDPSYKVFFGTESALTISAELEKNLQLFESLEVGGAKKLQNYLSVSKYQYEIALQKFIYRDYSSIRSLLNFQLIKEGLSLHLLDSIDQYTRRYFTSEKLRKILQYTIVFLGGSPTNTPAFYALMAHVDFNLGVYYPKGGFGKVVDGFTRLAHQQNVEILYNQQVKSIVVTGGKAQQVVTDSVSYDADIVLVNADYAFAETSLLSPQYQSYPNSYWKKRTIAPSAFIIYLGLNKKIAGLEHHNLFLDDHWEQHFGTLFDHPSWPESPSYYVSCPSKTDPTVAPADGENIFVLVPVAAGLDDSTELRERYFQKMMSHLEQLTGQNISNHIVVKRIFAHRDFSERYNAYKGTALGLSHTLSQSAVFRPKHRSAKVSNLFYTGQYTHPGVGVPMSIISSQIVCDEISTLYD